MRFTKLSLRNWRNFLGVDVRLGDRIFVVGANASGKSNLLDAFRFLRDIAEPRGGVQQAVSQRGGVNVLRSLHAQEGSDVVVEAELSLGRATWCYRLALVEDSLRRAVVKEEKVWKDGALLLDRPDVEDERDPGRLSQTHMEQVNANRLFRDVTDFLADVRYLHLVPQVIREPERIAPQKNGQDPLGGDFLQQLAYAQKENKRTFAGRLRRIQQVLQVAVPLLEELTLERDDLGRPHLQCRYEHWRPGAGRQEEAQFSDGTLRLIGLLWSLLDGRGPLLLEEPELSLHEAVVRHLPAMMWKAGRNNRRQILISTHSATLLSDPSIAPEEVLLLRSTQENTFVSVAVDNAAVRALLAGGMPMGEAVLPQVAPGQAEQILFKFGE